MKQSLAVAVPFDLFGSAGTGAGAQLLADALREMLADARREQQPSRCHAYRERIRLREFTFETLADYQAFPRQARQLARTALKRGEFLLWLGGNHLSVLPVLEALGEQAGSLVVQFDAHLDVYNLTGCTTEPSHGNFLLHATGPLPPIVHVGHRDLFLPTQHLRRHFRATLPAVDVDSGGENACRRLRRLAGKARRVWLDIDCDVLDPTFFPAVAHPQPFGLAPADLLQLLNACWSKRVVGVSISEFDPSRDRQDQSLSTLVWLLEYLLLKRHEK